MTHTLQDSLRMTSKAREELDTCPECDEEFVGLDTTMAGDLVVVHQENPIQDCTVDSDDLPDVLTEKEEA